MTPSRTVIFELVTTSFALFFLRIVFSFHVKPSRCKSVVDLDDGGAQLFIGFFTTNR